MRPRKCSTFPPADILEDVDQGGDVVSVGAFQWAIQGLGRQKGWMGKKGSKSTLSEDFLLSEGVQKGELPVVSPSCSWEVSRDGGLNIGLRFGKSRWRKKFVKPQKPSGPIATELSNGESDEEPHGTYVPPVPPLNLCLMVVGTRGDVQPFIALGIGLKKYGHRVRIASHSVYHDFVLSAGLEFYPLGGDPKAMIETIVRNRGILPTCLGDVTENRKQVRDIVFSTYDACISDDPEGVHGPFQADAIIANPPSYGHIHCAERLGIPLHMIFTMPWTPTKEFVNPNARISDAVVSKVEYVTGLLPRDRAYRWTEYVRERMNWISFTAVEDIVSIGMKDIIDQFRLNALQLKPLPHTTEARRLLDCRQVPFTYCWSPSLVPKPKDWGDHIDVVGFFSLNQSDLMEYDPPKEIVQFLSDGPPPIYIGFGSLVIGDPEALTRTIIEAMEQTGLRAIVSRGWGAIGADCTLPKSILSIGNCPHDWLFSRCSAVVHHGGAGTTAAGLQAGCPTFVVPFFGDQPFWGESCFQAGVGPEPVPIDKLDTKHLVHALAYMLLPRVKNRAQEIATAMHAENGVEDAIVAFHRHLPRDAILFKNRIIWNLSKDCAVDAEAASSVLEVLPPEKLTPWAWLWTFLGCSFCRRKNHEKRRIGSNSPTNSNFS